MLPEVAEPKIFVLFRLLDPHNPIQLGSRAARIKALQFKV